jgi:hypothetical protein
VNRESSEPGVPTGPTEEQRRRIRRSTIVLALVALAIYVAFIASGVMQARS